MNRLPICWSLLQRAARTAVDSFRPLLHGLLQIKSTEEVEFLKGRAQVLDEIEASMSTSTIRRLNQRLQDYVHTLVPTTAPKPSQPSDEISSTATAAEGIKAMIWALDKKEILPLISSILAELQEPSLQE